MGSASPRAHKHIRKRLATPVTTEGPRWSRSGVTEEEAINPALGQDEPGLPHGGRPGRKNRKIATAEKIRFKRGKSLVHNKARTHCDYSGYGFLCQLVSKSSIRR